MHASFASLADPALHPPDLTQPPQHGLRHQASIGTSLLPACPTSNREPSLYKVIGTDPTGRALTFACGTDLQALDKVRELMTRGFRDISVSDPKGRQTSGAAFEHSVGLEYD